MSHARVSELSIDPLFLRRWSPRAYTGEPIDEATLLSLFEAARWAPSGNNMQPWRFIYARNGTDSWETFLGLLIPSNRTWAKHASALAFLISKTRYIRHDTGEVVTLHNHAFDAGAAWASLAFQATLSGWHTRAIGGFDRAAARERLAIPEGYEPQVAIAIGRQGNPELLPDSLRERERPTDRKPLNQIVAEGRFSFAEP